jgi:hypothetical protein
MKWVGSGMTDRTTEKWGWGINVAGSMVTGTLQQEQMQNGEHASA